MGAFNKDRPVKILLVEDNQGDVLLTKEAFSESKIKTEILVAEDGEKALAFLRKQGEFKNAPTADIILMDMNMPKMTGCELLKEVKQDVELKCIPVIFFTSSKSPSDISGAYNLHVNSYLVKPTAFEQFSEIVDAVEKFWFSTAVFPDRPRKVI